jgi:DNA-binding transcriptional LysR family regulator
MCRLKEFRIFVAAYEERSFSSAARRENATQSGVSQQIQKLEAQLRVKLFIRSAKSIVPTPAGDAYYHHCIELLQMHDNASKSLERFRGLGGEVSVGMTPWMSRNILAPALSRFADRHPNVSLKIVEGSSRGLVERTRSGAISFSLVTNDGDYEGTVLAESPAALVARARNASVSTFVAEHSRYASLKVIVPPRQTTWRKVVEAYFVKHKLHVQQTMEISSTSSIVSLVASSDWVSILPTIVATADVEHSRIVAHALPDAPTLKVISAVAQEPGSEAAELFRRMLESEVTRLNRESQALHSLRQLSLQDSL